MKIPPRVKVRVSPGLEFEKKAGHPGRVLIGIDEVGRGCLAGPVVAAAVALPFEIKWEEHTWLHDVSDSKLLKASSRERLDGLIRSWAMGSAIGVASVEEIDSLNIYHASHLAMTRAVSALNIPDAHHLVDGNAIPVPLMNVSTAIVKGDQKCLSIACASIIAKVWRDKFMIQLDSEYPGYGFALHKGYPTKAHTEAIRKIGICILHRRSFGPVRDAIGVNKWGQGQFEGLDT